MRVVRFAPLLSALPLAACGGIQSALQPQGSDAAQIALLWWAMFGASGLILALVVGLSLWALLGRRRPAILGRGGWAFWAGAVFPAVALSALLFWALSGTAQMTRPPGADALRIEIVGKMWWWEVRYLKPDGGLDFRTANEIHLPVGRPVALELISSDVIHSFWIPSLGGKIDLVPGHRNRWRLEASRPGAFRGQCAEFCGLQHAKMALWAVAHEPEAFDAWLAEERSAAREPDNPLQRRGREVFLATGCGACHAIRGTPADGRIGPDLTHVGGRRSLAAGALPNNVGALEAWIVDAQRLKPGARMPSFQVLDAPSLHALALYLEGLR